MEPEECTESKDEPSISPSCSTDPDGYARTPGNPERKRSYTSIFENKSSSESDTSDNELFSPGKAEKCEGILENLIKSELCKMNRTFKINKYRTRKKSVLGTGIDENSSSETLAKEGTSFESQESESIDRGPENYIDNSEKLHLSAEENERYATIAKDLTILNTHGALDDCSGNDGKDTKKLYTGPYGRILSPFKKFSSFQKIARGVKRSPRKFPAPVLKRPKLQLSSSSSDQSTPEKHSTFLYHVGKSPSDGEVSEDSDGGDGGLLINEESEVDERAQELENELQKKSEKFSLSAINVKSILHKIITNENVVEMVRKAVYEEIEETEAKFEPKMTRSKVKQALETQGNVPQVWGISPTKQVKEKSSFLEIELPEEEEDDEDFNPEELPVDSDEDSESVVSSSCLSDLDLTLPSTPTTPSTSASLHKPSTPSLTDTDSQTILSPMGPPLQNKVPRSHIQTKSLGQKFQDAMDQDEARKREEEEELIASRTRSKYPLHDLSVFDIEANFVAPDITEDLYDTLCDNTEWQHFLQDLVKPAPVPVTEDSVDLMEEDEDPEYNYLEEKEKQADDLEDFRDDRAVKVSKKELNLLLDELHDAYGENDPLDAECRKTIKAQTEQFLETDHRKRETQFQQSLVLQIGDHEKRQIDDQMRKHVQLLTQTFVMAQTGEEEHKTVAETARMYLTEINKFAEMSETVYPNTTYRTCNLETAISIVSDGGWKKEAEKGKESEEEEESRAALFKYDNQVLPPLSQKQMETLWSSPCFMFPHLLPHGAFFKTEQLKKDRARVKFLESEDNLLAMGLEQFKDLADPKEYIHQFMLPCKSKKQIQIRIKNLSTKAAKHNPVKFYKQYKTLPPMGQCAPMFDMSQMKAVRDQHLDLDELPTWCRKFCGGIGFRSRNRKTKGQSLSFPVSTAGVAAIYFPSLPTSAPNTPSNKQTDSSQTDTSASSVDSTRSETPSSHTRLFSEPHKKKLDLNVATTSSSSGSFVPLTLASQGNPITICVLNKVSNSTVTIRNDQSAVTQSIGNQVTTCAAPTIIFINNGVQSHTQLPTSSTVVASSNTAVTSSSTSSAPTSSNTLLNPDPIQSALMTSNIVGTDSYTESGSVNDMNVDCVEPAASGSLVSVPAGGSFVSVPNDSGGCTVTVHPPQSLGTDTTVVLSSPCQDRPSPTSAARTPTPAYSTPEAITPTHSVSSSVDYTGNQLTPDQLTPSSLNSSTGSTPKSAIEIMASYAPYFVSPSERRNHGTSIQTSLETTPVKGSNKYVRLAPKPTPPSNEKPVDIKLEKKVSSPRRKQLQQRARAILPKGFVISKYDDSPTKRLASSLVDRAKHLQKKPYSHIEGFRKILPCPYDEAKDKLNENKTSILTYKRDNESYSSNGVKRKMSESEDDGAGSVDTLGCVDEAAGTGSGDTVECMEEDGEEAGGDTDSEDTQSEDTQEDSQEEIDSQEDEPDDDETHLANLMHASTTVRCDFPRDDVSKGRMCKKDRDRDTSLAMLAPDIIESDQQRDYRDTAFAQAYLHKVKKALRDDMDTLEKFLQLMYNFSKTNESPVKLYKDLDRLFVKYPELMADFAGFLLPEQAVYCDCYETHQEFNMARTFLRKLEIYFSKVPHQFHKMMKTFSRWYRKPGRRVGDLREQVEPMLKGQRYLLEEFSKFFPDDQPPESMMNEFEEVTLEDSEDDDLYDSVEEIDLLDDEEETLGTKRCECNCHNQGDDHYRKKKKHCYRCCLTVIDGELVYKVNKTTIKKISVTFGPSVRVADIIDTNTKTEDQSEVEVERSAEVMPGESTVCSGSEELPASSDWCTDNEGAEKENIEHYGSARPGPGHRKQDKPRSSLKNRSEAEASQKPTFLQRISKLSRPTTSGKAVRLSDVVSTATAPTPPQTPPPTLPDQPAATSDLESSSVRPKQLTQNSTVSLNERSQKDIVSYEQVNILGLKTYESEKVKQNSPEKISDLPNSQTNSQNDSAFSGSLNMSSGSNNDILAAAFNSAMLTEVSMDSMSMSFTLQGKSPEKKAAISAQAMQNKETVKPLDKVMNPKPVPATCTSVSTSVSAPVGGDNLAVSTNSSFTKVDNKLTDSPVKLSVPNTQCDSEQMESGIDAVEVNELIEQSKSPNFSPFSPYAAEVQAIISQPSPLANVSSPGIVGQAGKVIMSSKIRRITPIQVSDSSQHSISSFQSVVENSPLLCEATVIPNPFEMFGQDSDCNTDKPSNTKTAVTSLDVSGSSTALNETCSMTSTSQQSTVLGSSQKSDSNTKSDHSESLPGNIQISEPVTFSEDANEDFPLMPLPAGGGTLLSDESLLHCLGNKTHMEDHIHSISNLTNILHALEEKTEETQAKSDAHKVKSIPSLNNCSETPLANSKCPYSTSESAEKPCTVLAHVDQTSPILESNDDAHSSSCDSGSSDNRTLTPVDDGSRLSAVDDDNTSKQSAELKCDHNNENETQVIETHKKDCYNHNEQTYKPKYRDKDKSDDENDVCVVKINANCAKTLTENTADKDCNKIDIRGDSLVNDAADCHQVEDETESPCSSHSTAPGQVTLQVAGEITNSCDIDHGSDRKNKQKDKHKKKKSKKHKKKKEKGESSGNVFDKIKMFSCTSAAVGQSTPERLADDTSLDNTVGAEAQSSSSCQPNEKGDAASPVQTSDGEELPYTAGVLNAADLCSEVSSPSSSIEGHEWSKDTDKKILEACKTHGIKEKTFIKIAKQIGNVTPKQVRKRFGQLYKLILKPRLPKT